MFPYYIWYKTEKNTTYWNYMGNLITAIWKCILISFYHMVEIYAFLMWLRYIFFPYGSNAHVLYGWNTYVLHMVEMHVFSNRLKFINPYGWNKYVFYTVCKCMYLFEFWILLLYMFFVYKCMKPNVSLSMFSICIIGMKNST